MAIDKVVYEAELTALNSDKLGIKPKGHATLTIMNNQLIIEVNMTDVPANTEHWMHFHGFADGSDAQIATIKQDKNHDGFIDLPETEEVSGTTMVPFNNRPQDINIPTDTYPVAGSAGNFNYKVAVPLIEMQQKFSEVFHDQQLALDKRVIYVHGVPDSMALPASVKGAVGTYDAHTTLPIAVGKIKRV
ncbi:hypothetical protein BSQ39_02020 [Loigolactobacillus backii]|uniref:CHRD domain-containing protein n=1 Tax=Loigolactobacillus backii TaxID=375175 RepID=A0A192GZE4_9LACO|nr:hypothetical protein [Loigolactobacillus backii]ANK61904.1 hypothetical protein AYR53_03450 [Loigolactobacillus backii]ANK68902.1 hypothetical protein AYR56_01275 [Loigolactobacillus backii]PIO82424.1 hypothetical protein BSQ39_02020 [Loigolactobacillus backii]